MITHTLSLTLTLSHDNLNPTQTLTLTLSHNNPYIKPNPNYLADGAELGTPSEGDRPFSLGTELPKPSGV